MSARDDRDAKKAHFAWLRLLVLRQSWNEQKPLDTEEFEAELAQLFGLGQPIPPFAQRGLRDLIKSRGPYRLGLLKNGLAARRFRTERRDYERALKIADEIEKYENISSVEAAIAKITNTAKRQWPRSFDEAREFMSPEHIEHLERLLDERSKRSKG